MMSDWSDTVNSFTQATINGIQLPEHILMKPVGPPPNNPRSSANAVKHRHHGQLSACQRGALAARSLEATNIKRRASQKLTTVKKDNVVGKFDDLKIAEGSNNKILLSSFTHPRNQPLNINQPQKNTSRTHVNVTTFKTAGLERQLERAFHYFDRDKNGTISVREIKSMVAQLDLNISAAQMENAISKVEENVELDVEEFKVLLSYLS